MRSDAKGSVRNRRDFRGQLEQHHELGCWDGQLEQQLADESEQQRGHSLDSSNTDTSTLFGGGVLYCSSDNSYFSRRMQYTSFLSGLSAQENRASLLTYNEAKSDWVDYQPVLSYIHTIPNEQLEQNWQAFFSLFSLNNLIRAHRKAKKNKKDKSRVFTYERDLIFNLTHLQHKVKNGLFAFGPYRQFETFDSKRRRITVSKYEERIINWVLYEYLYALFEPSFIFDSYGNRVGKGQIRAVLRLQQFMRAKGNTHVLKIDFSKYFSSMSHQVALSALSKKVKNPFLLLFIESLFWAFVSDDEYDHLFDDKSNYRTIKNKGVPIGSLFSQLLANVIPNQLDHFIKDAMGFKHYLRYVDDLLFVGAKIHLSQLKDRFISFITNQLKLNIHPHKTSIVAYTNLRPVCFLGYRVYPYKILPSKSVQIGIRRARRTGAINQLTSYAGMLQISNSRINTQSDSLT
jgi:retron-type reverse transcriptase